MEMPEKRFNFAIAGISWRRLESTVIWGIPCEPLVAHAVA
jgi:hypothetical protein